MNRHVDQISRNPRVSVEKVRGIKYLHEFDRCVRSLSYSYERHMANT